MKENMQAALTIECLIDPKQRGKSRKDKMQNLLESLTSLYPNIEIVTTLLGTRCIKDISKIGRFLGKRGYFSLTKNLTKLILGRSSDDIVVKVTHNMNFMFICKE